MIYDATKNNESYNTYYLELIEHISSTKAYNLTNTFRDVFVSKFFTMNEGEINTLFRKIFPLIELDNDQNVQISFSLSG